MFPGARPGTDGDACFGAVPRWVHAPGTLEEAAEFIAHTSRERLSLAFLGGGTEAQLGTPLSELGAMLQTTRLSRIVEYVPADMIVTAEAGLTLSRLAETLCRQRQRLALDPPAADRATVGGVVAANSFGPRRAQFGSVRDLLIGVSIILADGTRARGGGKVVKNVAGFDLPKLMCGSLGTLGMIATATFRLHPIPEIERTLLLRSSDASEVRAVLARVRGAQLEPVSVVAVSTGDLLDLAVRFEGFGAGVSDQAARLVELQKAAGKSAEELDERAAQSWWQRHDEARLQGELRIKIAALPSQIESILRPVEVVRRGLRRGVFLWYASVGLGFLGGDPLDIDASTGALLDARQQLERMGGSLVLQAAPGPVRAAIGEWGSLPAAFPVMRNMKEHFDPMRRLNPGRAVGGL